MVAVGVGVAVGVAVVVAVVVGVGVAVGVGVGVVMSDTKTQTTTASIDYGRIAYEKHIETSFISIPREGMRTATWDELGDKLQDDWRQLAKKVIKAFTEQVVKDVY